MNASDGGGRTRVLVATDGSSAADDAARAFARFADPTTTEIKILTVLSAAMEPSAYYGTPQSDAETTRFVAETVERTVARLRADLQACGFHVEVRHRFGNPAEGILAEAADWDADMVVVGRRNLTRPARWLLGSVSEAVTRRAHVPVLVAA